MVRLTVDTGERLMEEVANAVVLGRKATASRSNSPTKRSRVPAHLDNEDVDYAIRRRRIREFTSAQSSFGSTTASTLEEDSIIDLHPSCNTTSIPANISSGPTDCCAGTRRYDFRAVKYLDFHRGSSYIEELRQEALTKQRPAGYASQRETYDKHRPARE